MRYTPRKEENNQQKQTNFLYGKFTKVTGQRKEQFKDIYDKAS